MKIAIVGTGAMGSVYAALFAEKGHAVWAVDVWDDHLAAIRDRGLRVEGASGDRLVTGIRTARTPEEAEPCDLYVLATKASGVEAAARSIAAVKPEDSLVLTIQNGLGAGERIAAHMPSDSVLLGVAEGFGASMKGPGHAHHNAMKLIRIGEMNGGVSDRARDLETLWREAGFSVKAFDDIDQLIWEKFICNVTFSAPCTVFDRTVGEMMADPASWKIALTCGLEAHTAGKAKGVAFSFDDAEAYITAFGRAMPHARPSMLLDHHARRPSEIDAINGMVPVVARSVGTTAPYNEVVSGIVRSREAEFTHA